MFDNVKYNGTVCIVTLVLTKIKVSLTSFKELKKVAIYRIFSFTWYTFLEYPLKCICKQKFLERSRTAKIKVNIFGAF